MNYCCLKCFWFQSLLAVYNVMPETLFSCVKNLRGWQLYADIGQNGHVRHEAKAILDAPSAKEGEDMQA